MKTFNIFKILVISLMLWGCSNKSSSTNSEFKATIKGQDPAADMATAKANYSAVQKEAKDACQFKSVFFVKEGEVCKVAPYPNPLSQQIDLIEKIMIPSITNFIDSEKKAGFNTFGPDLQKEHTFFVRTLEYLKASRKAIEVELETRSEEIAQAKTELDKALLDLWSVGCNTKGNTYSCTAPNNPSISETEFMILKQKYMRAVNVSVEKLNSIYQSMINNNIEDFLFTKELLKNVTAESTSWNVKILSASIENIEYLGSLVERTMEDTDISIELEEFSPEEFQNLQYESTKQYVAPETLELLRGRVSYLEKLHQFMIYNKEFLLTKVVESLKIGAGLSFSKYDKKDYDSFPSQNKLKVEMTLDTSEDEWLKQIKALDDIQGNPLLEKRNKAIEKIHEHIAKMKTAEAFNTFPIFADLPLENYEDDGVTETLKLYSAVSEFMFEDFPIHMNKKLHPFLTGQEKTQILIVKPFASKPVSNQNLLVIALPSDQIGYLSKDTLKTRMLIILLDWLKTLEQ